MLKAAISNVHTFVIKKGNEERRIRVRDVSIDNHFSYRNGKIVYASYRPDIRWGYRDYSDLQNIGCEQRHSKNINQPHKIFFT